MAFKRVGIIGMVAMVVSRDRVISAQMDVEDAAQVGRLLRRKCGANESARCLFGARTVTIY